MHYHHQNLNEKRVAGKTTTGTILRQGRAWLRFSDRFGIGWSWHFSSGLLHYGVQASGDEGRVVFSFTIPWILSLWFHFEWPWLLQKLGLDYESAKAREAKARGGSVVPTLHVIPACYDMDRDFTLRFFDKAVWWSVWWRDDYTSATDPKWRRGSWHYLDTLLGREKYTKTVLQELVVVVPLPEKRYRAHLEIDRSEWKRPRWPWPKTRLGSYIDFRKGGDDAPPVPGKGENSYDCGPDAIQAMSLAAVDVESAIGETVKRVLKNRVRYGGAHDYDERAS